jgi:hypothetical protein
LIWKPASGVCGSTEVRPLAAESWRCYNSGAVRAAIAATWTAVVADVLDKVSHLADEQDPVAKVFHQKVEQARAPGLTPGGVRAMQGIEGELLDRAIDLELIDSIGHRELNRIRQDRHLCVHPSLRHQGETYQPEPEVARAHLAVALSTLLLHAPIQGKRVQEAFTTYICDPTFSPTPAHLQASFFDRVRSGTRSRIITVAAKHALRELPPPPDIPVKAEVIADRMAIALKAFAERDRDLVRGALVGQMTQFATADGAIQQRAMLRLGDRDYFWDAIDQPVRDRLSALVDHPEPLPPQQLTVVALVGDPVARGQLPRLEEVFSDLSLSQRIEVMAARPAAYFVQTVIDAVSEAPNWATGTNIATRLLVQHAQFFTSPQLKELLTAWISNVDCRRANGMPEAAARMAAITTLNSAENHEHWLEFLKQARAHAPEGGYYSYDRLALEL